MGGTWADGITKLHWTVQDLSPQRQAVLATQQKTLPSLSCLDISTLISLLVLLIGSSQVDATWPFAQLAVDDVPEEGCDDLYDNSFSVRRVFCHVTRALVLMIATRSLLGPLFIPHRLIPS